MMLRLALALLALASGSEESGCGLDDDACFQEVYLLQRSTERRIVEDPGVGVALVQNASKAFEASPADACLQLLEALKVGRTGELGSFGSHKVSLEVLGSGLAEIASRGVLRLLAADTSEQGRLDAQPCWAVLQSLGVQYDHARSLIVSESTPHLWDAVTAMVRRSRHDGEQLRINVAMYAAVFGVPPCDETLLDMNRSGGFDVMFDVLRENTTDLIVLQAAWAALSDNVENTRLGAELAANHGGEGKGLAVLVNLMKDYKGKHAYQPTMPYGLRYESIHDICGILMHDDAQHTWRDIAMEHGFMEEALLALLEESNDTLTVENACEGLALTTRGSPENQERLRKLGGLEPLMIGIRDHKPDGVMDFTYRYLNSCSAALLPLARSSSADAAFLKENGLLEAMDLAMPFVKMLPPRGEPWLSAFPWSDVEELRAILAAA